MFIFKDICKCRLIIIISLIGLQKYIIIKGIIYWKASTSQLWRAVIYRFVANIRPQSQKKKLLTTTHWRLRFFFVYLSHSFVRFFKSVCVFATQLQWGLRPQKLTWCKFSLVGVSRNAKENEQTISQRFSTF